MIELKTPAEIDAMRAAGEIVARTLDAVHDAVDVGVSLLDLDALAREIISTAGAGSSFLGYRPHFADTAFPGVICTSVNDVVLHGVPTAYRLRDGDLLSVDFGAHLGGWHGDAAFSIAVGHPEPADLAMIATAERALAAGIDAARPGARIGDIGHAIAAVIRPEGYGILADYGGHGIGRAMHEDPSVPNHAPRGRGMTLRPGLVIAIEPALIAGGHDEYVVDADGWSLRAADSTRGVHVEHTVAVTEAGPVVLTAGSPVRVTTPTTTALSPIRE